MFKKEGNLVLMRSCVDDGWREGMHGANERMIERDVTMKEVVKHHVIPLMHDVKNQMLEMTSVSDKDKCFCMSEVLLAIALSEELVDDDVAAKQAWEERRRIGEERRRIEEERRRIEEERSKPWWKKIKDVL